LGREEGCEAYIGRSRTAKRADTGWGEARGRLARRGWCCVDTRAT
jgi:hypothetical protein